MRIFVSSLSFFIYSVFGNLTWGAIQKKDLITAQESKIRRHSERVSELRREILKIEGLLTKKNQEYIRDKKNMDETEFFLKEAQKEIKLTRENISELGDKINIILRNYMTRALDEKSSSRDLYLDRVMIQGLVKKRNQYRKFQEKYIILSSRVDLLLKEIEQYRGQEQELKAIIADLERSREMVTKKFVDQREAFRKLKRNWTKKNPQKLLKEKFLVKKMHSPLKSFLSVKKDRDRKGVVYRFSGESSLHSGRAGRVQYLGRLSNYGDLLIVNHGDDVRSIFLGNIHVKVKKGDRVQRGQILGYAKVGSQEKGELYFEVRVKNHAHHNTLGWIDTSSFSSTTPATRKI